MPFAYWCVLIAAMLPTVWVLYAKRGATDNHNPRAGIEQLPPAKRRAYGAHLNAIENFPFFAAAVIIALQLGAPVATVSWLAGLYILIRIIHGLLYIADQASLRSASYLAGFIVNVVIFVLPAFK
jgi:uncharacterized MAPEG superfamily protein